MTETTRIVTKPFENHPVHHMIDLNRRLKRQTSLIGNGHNLTARILAIDTSFHPPRPDEIAENQPGRRRVDRRFARHIDLWRRPIPGQEMKELKLRKGNV